MSHRKISIITVVYNDVKMIENTIQSVVNLSYPEIEYLVIDGGSNDGTQAVINKFQNQIDLIVSEADKGIYDAMNKGVLKATGDYLCFMNSGDSFAGVNVLDKIFEGTEDAAIIYCNNLITYEAGFTRQHNADNLSNIWKGSICSHQAMLIKRAYQREHLYALNAGLCSDFHFFYHAYKSSEKLYYKDINLAITSAGGVSDQNRVQVTKEFRAVIKDAGDLTVMRSLYYFFKIASHQIKGVIRALLPQVVVDFLVQTKHETNRL
ncbi:MAG: glycosyltransferase family 2 protein [SAR324 cluster bacterium]|nr:glycosyltransferase family 2 protein [SAR324 cluster bacterium]